MATLLLAAQEGGRPLHEAAWVLVGAILTTLVDAYASHISTHREGLVKGYAVGLGRNIVLESPRFYAALVTVIFLVLAAILHWQDDHRNPDGSVTPGYTTIGLNLNVVLLFILGFVAARRSGSSWRGTLLFASLNGALGLLIVFAEIELE
jgi:hypothetical protein